MTFDREWYCRHGYEIVDKQNNEISLVDVIRRVFCSRVIVEIHLKENYKKWIYYPVECSCLLRAWIWRRITRRFTRHPQPRRKSVSIIFHHLFNIIFEIERSNRTVSETITRLRNTARGELLATLYQPTPEAKILERGNRTLSSHKLEGKKKKTDRYIIFGSLICYKRIK